MLINKSYKTELKPNKEQIFFFVNCSGARRFIWNWALNKKIELYKAEKKSISKYDLSKEITQLKETELQWLSEIPRTTVTMVLKDLDEAYQNFFRRVKKGEKPGFPKFKSKYRNKNSFTFQGTKNIRVKPDKIKLPRIGWVNLKEKGYIPTAYVKILFITVSEQAGRWFISVTVEENIYSEKATGEPVGIDLGVRTLATCSDGRAFENPKVLYKYEHRLKRYQRKLARQQKQSNNRKKTKQKIAKLHYKISNIRKDNIHKATSDILAKAKRTSERPSCIILENLNIEGMVKNSHLAKTISDASMREFRRQIEYKAKWYGTDILLADTFYPSSKTCSECGEIKAILKLSERTFVCESCGLVMDRDLNAAINLKNLTTVGLTESKAFGEDVRPSKSHDKLGSLNEEGTGKVDNDVT